MISSLKDSSFSSLLLKYESVDKNEQMKTNLFPFVDSKRCNLFLKNYIKQADKIYAVRDSVLCSSFHKGGGRELEARKER